MEVFIGLGSNLGDPRRHLAAGLAGLKGLAGYRHLALSALYRTAPVGKTDQPAFLNAVARGMFEGSAQELLAGLLAVEAHEGRQRLERWGPRSLDLDLLLFGTQIIAAPGLCVPHPEMHHRAFVLVPLMELAPELALPIWGRTAGQLLAALGPDERAAQAVERVAWE
ncbi:MAG: 2-amino-4-hydroxy-6-hydroxymethyldihydropteridine diphosphokinase [Pseudomonadota bacterium]